MPLSRSQVRPLLGKRVRVVLCENHGSAVGIAFSIVQRPKGKRLILREATIFNQDGSPHRINILGEYFRIDLPMAHIDSIEHAPAVEKEANTHVGH